jgi:hypothetical protein
MIGTSGTVTGVHFGSATISYSVTNSCGTDVATFIDTVIAPPAAGLINGPDSICVGDIVHMSNSETGGAWASSNTAVASIDLSSGVVTGVSAGTVSISYSVGSVLCGTSTTEVILKVRSRAICNVGIKPVTAATLNIYPNPSTGKFIVELPATGNRSIITVTDMAGRIVFTKTVEDTKASSTTIDMGNMPSASYIIKVSSGDTTYRQKLDVIR